MVDLSVSVLVPSFDAEEFIGTAIRSALDQPIAPLEVLVQDGGSRDGTVAAVEGIGDSRAPLPDVGTAPDAAASTPGGDARTVPQLMICHPDERGPSAAAEVIQECINRAPAFSSIEIPPGTYVLHRQIVVSTPSAKEHSSDARVQQLSPRAD